MAQGVLPFKYEEDKNDAGMTALGGLPVYLDLVHVIGLSKSIKKHLKIREGSQGWTDSQIVLALVLLNIAGGSSVDDLNVLEGDRGFCDVLNKVELHGLHRKVRRALERRWRKEKRRTVPSPSAVFRYLSSFHDKESEGSSQGQATIPELNDYLKGLVNVNKDVLSFLQNQSPEKTATLDMDATLIETTKKEALYSYEGLKAYQPLNTWWAEHEVIVHTEFRDGNVPAGFEQLRVFKEALTCLPEGVEKVRLRSDTAGYQHELLKYCEKGEDKRFGRIEFAIGCDVTPSFKESVLEVPESEWKPLYREINGEKKKTKTEWAEVCFVPNAIGHSKTGLEYRYLAKREAIEEQLSLPGMENQLSLPFPNMNIKGRRYKVFGLVTNMKEDGEEVIHWLHQRCGKSEEAHGVMKDDLAGGKLPSGDFGENAAWWWIMMVSLNLNGIMKKLVLGGSWVKKRMKAIRFSLINIPGRLINHARSLLLRLPKEHPSFDLLIKGRMKIAKLQPLPAH
jgi:hypothetical protein